MIVDDGMNERCAGDHVAGDPVFPGPLRGDGLVPLSLETSDVAPAATVGDVAEFLDVDVDHRSGMLVLVAAGGFAGADVDVAGPIDPAPGEDRVNGRGGHAELGADTDWSQPLLPPQMHDLADQSSRGLVRAVMRP
ncbi:hypothetical protein O159_06970 [Leifsonia xyli subsp. cynodontis DSM 46306]|uniref:Uncharacterized protein n=2 Tax=Leifsonia xyli subsp. cynodontis DSM 46306 TaxID=1389489 RepID=U3P4T2_LEIXC|nr:hypothetical protein O159_01620 [Leifsonia xyli subsp. cynodontis DSM 46306]AGW40786.1 hypothetical protein O159_05990 [Leifsonia xyli subsp. cynodontis DSM 46306]AGW40874.1 hypothetical protein O159_06970 [Leifsonia xyli subsp. cynodontis DSM 46306]